MVLFTSLSYSQNKVNFQVKEDAEKLYFRGIQPLSVNQVDAETSIGGNFDINYKTALGDEMTFSINQLFFLTQLKNTTQG